MAMMESGLDERASDRGRLELRPPTALECRLCGEICDVDADNEALLDRGMPDPCARCGGRIFLVLLPLARILEHG